MAFITLKDVHKTYGEQHLLRGIDLVISETDCVGLLGPNGCGKSTLLRILAGDEELDEGIRTEKRGLRLGFLPQDPEVDSSLTVRQVVEQGLARRKVVLQELDVIHEKMAEPDCDMERLESLMKQQSRLDTELEQLGGHDVEHRIEAMIHDVGLPDPDAPCEGMSGGERRRAALARLLLSSPEILLLDEPTNHLDADVTAWLEDYLRATKTALVVVTHDRYFLDRVVDRIVEVDQGALHDYDCSYGNFLIQRAERLVREKKTEATRLNLLRRETEWMRSSPPARTSKSKSRIQGYQKLSEAAPEARAAELAFEIPIEQRLGDRVVEMRGITKSYGDNHVLKGLDLEVQKGDRIGIVGPNGAGKSTTIKIAMGLLEPDAGTVKVGKTVKFSYIDQARADLDPTKLVIDEVGRDNNYVIIGDRTLRIESYLEQFLFPTKLQRSRVGDLSGGERNRVLIAKLLAKAGNVVVLDEPTNDLDLMTLRVLEEALIAFPGCVLVVSHDRYFLDRVATRILYISEDGTHRIHEGDISSLFEKIRVEAGQKAQLAKAAQQKQVKSGRVQLVEPTKQRKLSSREKEELDGLPEKIAAAEAELDGLDKQLADPAFYQDSTVNTDALMQSRGTAEKRVAKLYARWEELEERS